MNVVTGSSVVELLGEDAETLLDYRSHTISKQQLHLPDPNFIDRIFLSGDRSNVTVRNLQTMLDHGRLGGSGYLSILPVDQGVEHNHGPLSRLKPQGLHYRHW